MLGIDTNVLVRLLVADDPPQTRRARKLIERAVADQEPVLISLLVVMETEWVLRSRYGFDRAGVHAALRRTLQAREFVFDDEPALEEALFNWEDSACGFADCLIAAHQRRLGCRATATFDARAARLPGTLQL
ncbi:MAG: PIN domain-containing protein [Steroidobacteraceae bacterium]